MGGPLQNMTLRAHRVDENGAVATKALTPPLVSDERGRTLIPSAWQLDANDKFVAFSVNERGDAKDTTLLGGDDELDATPTMSLSGFFTYTGPSDTIYVTPTTTLVYETIKEMGNIFNDTTLNLAKDYVETTFGISKDDLYKNHNDLANDDLLKFTMELTGLGMAINDATTKPGEEVSKTMDSSVMKGIAEMVKEKGAASTPFNLEQLGEADDIGMMIHKVAQKRHSGDNSVNLTGLSVELNHANSRSGVHTFYSHNKNLSIVGESPEDIQEKRIKMKRTMALVLRGGRSSTASPLTSKRVSFVGSEVLLGKSGGFDEAEGITSDPPLDTIKP